MIFLQNLEDGNMKHFFEEEWNSSFRKKRECILRSFQTASYLRGNYFADRLRKMQCWVCMDLMPESAVLYYMCFFFFPNLTCPSSLPAK